LIRPFEHPRLHQQAYFFVGTMADKVFKFEWLDEMESRVSRAEARGGEEMFELGEYTFGSFEDFGKWVLKEQVPTSGIFWDIFSVLVNMRPKGLSGKERADEQHSSERISTTMFENNLLAAMSHSRPVCLYGKGGTGALVDLEMGFGACKSYAQWISGVESVKKMPGKQLKDFTAGVQEGRQPEGHHRRRGTR
jgi:hypothetical protein